MGGRGSGGGRSGGGGGSASSDKQPRLISANQYYQEKYSEMTDLELNRAYVNAQVLMRKEQAKVMHEREKLSELVEEFKAMPSGHPDLNKKWDAIEKQTTKLNDAQVKSNLRSQAYLLAVNEKLNVRSKHKSSDVRKMTNGQLDSFYNNSYKESNKARQRIENTSNPKTRAKYQKIYDLHNANFNKANAERERRGLDGKNW